MATTLKASLKIGTLAIVVESDSMTELMDRCSFLGEVAAKVKPNQNVRFRHREAKGYDFYELVDNDTNHVLPFGVKKDNKGFYPKEWEEPYSGGGHDDSRDRGSDSGYGEPPAQQPSRPSQYSQQRPAGNVPPGGGVGAPPARNQNQGGRPPARY